MPSLVKISPLISKACHLCILFRGVIRALSTMNSADVGKILAATSTAKYFIEYGGFLSNHVSHGVIALHRLEASPDHIQRFVDDLLPKLEDTNSDKPDSRSF